MSDKTLAHLGPDVAEAFALVPLDFNHVSVNWMGSLKKFSAYVHPHQGYCESGYGDTAVDAMREALSKIITRFDYVEIYSAARLPTEAAER